MGNYNKTNWDNDNPPAINDVTLGNIENGIAQASNPVVPSSGASITMLITTDHADAPIVPLQIDLTVTGGAITINRNGGGAKPLEDGEGNAIDELLSGVKYYSIVEEASQYVLVGGATFKGYKNIQYYTSGADTSLIVSSAKGTILAMFFDTRPTVTSNSWISDIIIDSVNLGIVQIQMATSDVDGTGNVGFNTQLRFEDNFTITFTNGAGSIHIFYALD